jgi:predicted MPP superfamily phosphohydrolase
LSFFTSRRRFLQAGAAVAATGALAVVGDGTFFEANNPTVVSIEIPLPRLPQSWDGFRIAQLSDLHYDDHFSVVPIRKAIDLVNGLQPDLVVVTGDFVTSPFAERRSQQIRAAKAIEPCAQLVAQMRAPFGILASLGNHDVGTDGAHITEVLQSHGISVLRNRSVALERNGERLWLSGLDDVLEGKYDLKLALKGIPQAEPVVLLVHEPDFANYVKNVPLTLYTNVGIGTIWVPMRLNCPPEVTLITLRATAG